MAKAQREASGPISNCNYKTTSVWNGLSVFTLIIALAALVVGTYAAIQERRQADIAAQQLKNDFEKLSQEAKEQEVRRWQASTIYSIIDKGLRGKFEKGMTFDEVSDHYFTEASKESSVKLPKGRIADKELERILFDMIGDGLVYKMHDGRYMINRAEMLSGFGRSNSLNDASMFVLSVLAGVDKGKHTDETLQAEVVQRFQLTPQEYRFVITNLISGAWVVRKEDGKLYCASSLP